jgi:hypothetical protein
MAGRVNRALTLHSHRRSQDGQEIERMQISEQHVRECAYYIWEKAGRIHGHAVAHWMRAEAELRAGVVLADGQTVEAKPAAVKAAPKVSASKSAPAKTATTKTVAAKTASPKAPAKAAAPKTVTPKTVTPKVALAKPVAAKTAKASKAAVTAGLAAKAKPARAPASMH